jgi:predicted nucleic acid-binding protein
MSCTVDASVFVAAARLREAQSAASNEFLDWLRAESVPVFCPTLVLPECSAAVIRPTGDLELATEVVEMIVEFPALRQIALDELMARRAAEIARTLRVRGGDAVYVAVAEAQRTTLVTWDGEVLQRAPAFVPTMTPAQWLAKQKASP